jgi:hypothetical protein
MDHNAIFGPVLAMLVLTIIVWVYMFAKRMPWIQSANLTPEQFKPGEFEKAQPDDVLNPSSNFKNLFEIPILFYVICGYLFMSGTVDMMYVVGAWVFVASRFAHSFVQCTFNHVMTRFMVYLLGALVVFAMIGRAVFQFLM